MYFGFLTLVPTANKTQTQQRIIASHPKSMTRQIHVCMLCLFLTLVHTVSTEILADCGKGNLTINMEGDCAESTCIGECLNSDTCCLEKCYAGKQPSAVDLEGCIALQEATGDCRDFENQTACLAENLNKSFSVCWKHAVYFISTHPDSEQISGFNPLHCPCDPGLTRRPGTCWFEQCADTSFCEERRDFILDIDVCCLHSDIFPQESDCESTELLDVSVHSHLNVSTLAQCQELCTGGLCRMPDPNKLPACCKTVPQSENKSDGGLNGAVIAVIVTVIVVLVIVGIIGMFVVYRIKKEESQMKTARNSAAVTNITGIEEIIEKEQIWDEEGYENPTFQSNGYIQSKDDSRHVTQSDFEANVHSLDKLQNGEVHDFENQPYSTENGSFDEERSFSNYRKRRTGSLNSGEMGSNPDDVKYVFDDGKGNVSDDNVQYEFNQDSENSSEEALDVL